MANLQVALAAFAPQIAESFRAIHVQAFNRMVKEFGPSLNGIYNSGSAKFYRESIARFVVSDGDRMSSTKSICRDKLRLGSEAYAQATVKEWEAKINAKLGELEGAEVKHMTETTFVISGTKNGRRVQIEQQMIINTSSKGAVFNQFPARIYVDGKFTSAKKFASL